MKFEEIIIELSHNCNLSCIMCGFGKDANPYKKEKFMSFEQYKEVLNQLAPLTKTVRLNGRGESTIHPEFLTILDYTKDIFPHLNINLFSNMSFNNREIIEGIKRNKVQIFVSIDSPEKEELSAIRRGSDHNLIMSNLENMEDTKIRPFIVFTVQEANIHRIADIGRFAAKNKCHIIYNAVRRDEGIDNFVKAVKNNLPVIEGMFKDVAEFYKGLGLKCMVPDQISGIETGFRGVTQTHGSMNTCPALHNELCILYDGTVTPCNMFNPYVYGNIFKNQLEDIWVGNKRIDFLESYKQYYYCKDCANLGI
jgi:MoaA/NifB/PqqE/SkfB family radical SAM enzyme